MAKKQMAGSAPDVPGAGEAQQGHQEALIGMFNTVHAMMAPILERQSLERFAACAMQSLVHGDNQWAAANPEAVARNAWNIAEAMAIERVKRGSAALDELQAALQQKAGEVSGQVEKVLGDEVGDESHHHHSQGGSLN